jgi:hypothetical protein
MRQSLDVRKWGERELCHNSPIKSKKEEKNCHFWKIDKLTLFETEIELLNFLISERVTS